MYLRTPGLEPEHTLELEPEFEPARRLELPIRLEKLNGHLEITLASPEILLLQILQVGSSFRHLGL